MVLGLFRAGSTQTNEVAQWTIPFQIQYVLLPNRKKAQQEKSCVATLLYALVLLLLFQQDFFTNKQTKKTMGSKKWYPSLTVLLWYNPYLWALPLHLPCCVGPSWVQVRHMQAQRPYFPPHYDFIQTGRQAGVRKRHPGVTASQSCWVDGDLVCAVPSNNISSPLHPGSAGHRQGGQQSAEPMTGQVSTS